jgi:hypothetical protein
MLDRTRRAMPRKRHGKHSYEVGYRKPPKATRFKPGQSGNPRGRTKRSKGGRTLLEETLNEVIVVNEGGVPQRMTKREAFFKTLVARAFKDNRSAMLLIKTMDQYDVLLSDDAPTVTIEFVTPPRPPEEPPRK